MPRGIRNKPKEVEKVATPEPIVEAPQPKRFEAATTSAMWTPKPDMGNVKQPAGNCGDCQHEKALHYGGPKNWCNRNGCACQELK